MNLTDQQIPFVLNFIYIVNLNTLATHFKHRESFLNYNKQVIWKFMKLDSAFCRYLNSKYLKVVNYNCYGNEGKHFSLIDIPDEKFLFLYNIINMKRMK